MVMMKRCSEEDLKENRWTYTPKHDHGEAAALIVVMN